MRVCKGLPNTLSALPVRMRCGNESLGVNETARISRSCACSCVTGFEASRVSHLEDDQYYAVGAARLYIQNQLSVISDTREGVVFCRVPVDILGHEV